MKNVLRNLCLVAVLLCTHTSALHAQGEGLEQLLIRSITATDTDLSHIDGAVYMRGSQPVLAFGVVQLPDSKPQYSYFVLFKKLSAPADDFKVTGPLRSESNRTTYKVNLQVGKREFVIAHEFEIDDDLNKVLVDDLKLGEKPIKAGASRFFVVDLNCDPPSITALTHKLPATVPDPRAQSDHLEEVRKLADALFSDKELAEQLR